MFSDRKAVGISKGFHSMEIERSAKTLSTLADIQCGKESRLAQALVIALKTKPTFNHPTRVLEHLNNQVRL